MIYRKEVSWAETATEEADDRGQARPPRTRATQKTEDNKYSRKDRCHILTLGSRSHTEHRKEGEDIWDNHHKVGDCKAEHRGKILPQRSVARAIATNLRHRVLEEDIDADNDDKYTADKAQNMAILLNLRLHHRIEEVGNYRHQRIGTSHTQTGENTRFGGLAERTLDTQHSHRANRN